MLELSIIQQICIWALPVLLSITLHEASHAYVADYFGDHTAKALGRLSLNPIRHVDLFGSIILPLLIGALTHFQFLFGYAKPVPIQWSHLRQPQKRNMILVALSGPFSNFLMAFLWALGFKIGSLLHPESNNPALFLLLTAHAGMLINLVLGFLNLLPLPPLDGSRVVSTLLPPRQGLLYAKLEPYGFIILIILILTNILGLVLIPLINAGLKVLQLIFQI